MIHQSKNKFDEIEQRLKKEYKEDLGLFNPSKMINCLNII